MRQFIDVTGKTEDDAIKNALAQLNMDRDDVSVEVLERAKSGFLGFGSCPAKVRVSYGPEETDELPEIPAEPQAEKQPEVRREKKSDRKPKPVKKPVPETKAAEKRSEKKQTADQKPKPEKKQEPKPDTPSVQQDAVLQEIPAGDEKAQEIQRFLTGLLEHMGSSASVKVYLADKDRYKVMLEGQNLGALIGRRGETLDAIQQLTSYAVNRTGNRVRIQLDAEGYREKREKSLESLAHKVAGKVLKYRRSMTLEPMNAYERHVIHAALQDVEGVTTYSTGVDPNRRVIVALDRDRK